MKSTRIRDEEQASERDAFDVKMSFAVSNVEANFCNNMQNDDNALRKLPVVGVEKGVDKNSNEL